MEDEPGRTGAVDLEAVLPLACRGRGRRGRLGLCREASGGAVLVGPARSRSVLRAFPTPRVPPAPIPLAAAAAAVAAAAPSPSPPPPRLRLRLRLLLLLLLRPGVPVDVPRQDRRVERQRRLSRVVARGESDTTMVWGFHALVSAEERGVRPLLPDGAKAPFGGFCCCSDAAFA